MFKKRTFIVLSGGGAKGIAHLAIMELIKRNRITALVGTSAGALAASLYSFYNGDISKIVNAIERINSLPEFVNIENYFNELKGKGLLALSKKITSELKLLKGDSLFPFDKFEKLLYDIFGNIQMETLSLPLYITAVSLKSGNYTIFTKGKLVPRLMASMAIPAIFPPQKINGSYYVDGGYLDNLPVSIAFHFGATNVIASDISENYRGLISDIKGLSLIFHMQGIFQKNIIQMEQNLSTELFNFDLDRFKWYQFSKYREIFEQAKEDVKKGFIKNKQVNRKFIQCLLKKHDIDVF